MSEWKTVAEAHSPQATKEVAASLARALYPGSVVALDGDLGAGKTQFVQGLACALGVGDTVVSPTFNLMIAYDGSTLPLYHFDLYRLESPAELEDIGFYEFVEAQGVSCIEWASKFPTELPDERLEVYLLRGEEETHRVIQARAFGLRAAAALDLWASGVA